MAQKKKNEEEAVREEQNAASSTPIKYILAVLCFGLALLILYSAFAEPVEGTAMQSVKNIIRGLSGDIPFLLSIIFAWVGVLFAYSARGKRIKTFNVISYLIMFLSIFAAVHMFSAKDIMDSLNVHSYPQFIVTSYRNKTGGGILGSILAYFLYEYIGVFGGCAACLLIVVLTLIATGRAEQFFNWGKKKAEISKVRSNERKARLKQENDSLFENFEEEPRKSVNHSNPQYSRSQSKSAEEFVNRRRRNQRIRERVSDPDREIMYIPDHGDVDADRRRAATQAFYDPDLDEEVPRNKRTKRKDGIEVPKTISEIKQQTGTKEKKSRLQNPDSRPNTASKRGYDDETLAKGDISDSSVSIEAMSAVAGQLKRTSAKKNTFYEDDDATEEDIDDIFTVEKTDEEDKGFIPTRYGQKKESDGRKKAQDSESESYVSGIGLKTSKVETFVETETSEYNYPPIDLLERGEKEDTVRRNEASDNEKAEILMDTLLSFGIKTHLSGIAHGPAVTRFELQPEAGIKLSRITALSDDIAYTLAAESVRIEAPIPGKNAVGVEIPNDKIETVRLRDVLESQEALKNPSKIAFGLGKDNSGRYVVADISKMPHVLIAGQTGSGKSVCINSIVTSILYRSSPEDVRMILVDPKVVELQVYNDIPHLIAPVVTDPKKAAAALQWAVSEMLDRYKKFSKKHVRGIKGYNDQLEKGEAKMPQIVIIIDELADLMMAAPGEVEESICRIAQLARAAGMHLVIATQRPSVNVITGIIKANIPTRIAFKVASMTDSRVMIDHGGAEKLLGNGDMLFVPNGGKTLRVQGSWVSDKEVENVVNYIKERSDTNYDEDVQEQINNSVKSDAEIEDSNNEYDDRLAEAVEIVVEAGQASVSMLQRRMRVGYARAGRLIDEMQKRHIISEADGAKPRNVLMTREQFREQFGEDI